MEDDQDFHHHMEYDPFTSPILTINPPSSHDLLDVDFPFDEVILEAMNKYEITWEDVHHR
jgi:hypothetical protein